jgi:peptidoglycan/LPS O-acetylase OafA/YrhL
MSGHLSRLDHLRFLAAGLVAVYHYSHFNLPQWSGSNPVVNLVREGHTGVALFIVMSGFLFGVITYGKEISYSQFIINRIIRIYPAYVFILLIGAYITRASFGMQDILMSLLPFTNSYMPLLQNGKLVHLWTISIELQYYLIFPFILRFVHITGPIYCLALIGLATLMRAIVWEATGTVQDLAYWTIIGRIDQFMIGMMLAYAYKGERLKLGNPLWTLLSSAVLLAIIELFALRGGYFAIGNPSSPYEGWWIVWPDIEGAGWGFVMMSYLMCRVRLPRTADWAMSILGQVSYSIYLVHLIVFPAVMNFMPHPLAIGPNFQANVLLTGVLVFLPVVVVVALAVHLVIERPFFSFKRVYVLPAKPRLHKVAPAVRLRNIAGD